MANRITQSTLETLAVGGNPNARITQSTLETLAVGGNPNARITQSTLEVLAKITAAPVVTVNNQAIT